MTVTVAAMVAVLPVLLVGASGVLLRRELGISAAQLGLTVSIFFTASAVVSVLGGRFVERIGAGRALTCVAVCNLLVLLGIAALVESFAQLIALLVISGVANGIAWPATDLALAREVTTRQGLTFGIKQSGVPLAALAAGASLPLIAVTVGWRWIFVAGAVIAGAVALTVPSGLAPPRRRNTSGRVRDGDIPTGPLVLLAVAMGSGTAAALALATFFVEAAVIEGIPLSLAGWLLGAGSIAGIIARLLTGWLADRQLKAPLSLVAGMLAVGGVGYVLLALGGSVVSPVGALIAFSLGYGWTGLLMFSVVRLNPNAPAAATGIVLTGGAGGSGVGPFLIGLVASAGSFRTAWLVAGAAALTSSVLVAIATGWLVRMNREMLTEGCTKR